MGRILKTDDSEASTSLVLRQGEGEIEFNTAPQLSYGGQYEFVANSRLERLEKVVNAETCGFFEVLQRGGTLFSALLLLMFILSSFFGVANQVSYHRTLVKYIQDKNRYVVDIVKNDELARKFRVTLKAWHANGHHWEKYKELVMRMQQLISLEMLSLSYEQTAELRRRMEVIDKILREDTEICVMKRTNPNPTRSE